MIEIIWRDFHQQLLSFIRNKVANKEEAEDILQDVFIKVNKQLGTLKEQERLVPWLFSICRNTIIDHFRKRNRMESHFEEVDIDSISGLSHFAQERGSIENCLTTLIDELDDNYRTIVKDSEIRQIKQSAIAEKYNLSLSATKSRIKRGREKLRNKLMQCCSFEFSALGVEHHCKNKCGCS